MTFENLDIIKPILDAILEEGYITPSEIQQEALPLILEGRDLLASAQTGTGKTAAFALPIIQSLYLNKEDQNKRGPIKALVLAPTRELAEQIKASFKIYASKINVKVGAIYGGASQKAQEGMLNKGIDVLVATPGRLIDLMNQKIVKLNEVEYFVLDEADTLLDMGFIRDVKFIKGFIPKERQTLMFSATISKEVSSLASELLVDPVQLELAPPTMMLDKINHSVFFIDKKNKKEALLDLLTQPELESVLVFTRTKHGANKLVTYLEEYGLECDAIHGNKSQNKRQQALDDFKARKLRVLVATDIAARGIDINELSHVINFDLPESPETYIHRIGRTGRKGLKGEAYSFCSPDERGLLREIEKHTGLTLKVKELVPVSEDSKFRKVIDIILDNEKKNKEENIKTREKTLASTSPRDFGQKRENSKKTKNMYHNKAAEAFIEVEEETKKSRSASFKKTKKSYNKQNPEFANFEVSEEATDSRAKNTYGDKRERSRSSYNDRRVSEKRAYGKSTSERGDRSYGKPYAERGEKKSYGEKDNKRSYRYDDRAPSRGNARKSNGDTSFGRKSYNDSEAARSENFRAMTDRPSRGPRKAYGDKNSRSNEGRDKRSSWNKDGYSKNVEFTGRPKSPNRPKRDNRDKGHVDVTEKELYSKKPASRSYGNKSRSAYKSSKPKNRNFRKD